MTCTKVYQIIKDGAFINPAKKAFERTYYQQENVK